MKYTDKEIEGIENLCRFLCEHQEDLHRIIMRTARDIKETNSKRSDILIMNTPIIQGTRNQSELSSIGKQMVDVKKIRIGVDAMLKGGS